MTEKVQVTEEVIEAATEGESIGNQIEQDFYHLGSPTGSISSSILESTSHFDNPTAFFKEMR